MPTGDLDLDEIAGRTPGFVVADLAALVREAALRAASRASTDGQPPKLNQDDLVGALSVIRPLSRSASEELTVGNVTLDDVGDMAEAKQALTEAVLWPLQHPDTFARLGVDPPRGVLLYGPPGCGKTFVVRALASTGQLSVHAVKGSELMDKWVGASEKAVRELFRRARDSAPSLVFLDEVDALAPRRGQSFDSGVTDRVVAALLTELDGIDPLRDVVVLGATNRPDLIDPALLRPGRLERLVFVEPPDAAARREILRTAGKSIPLSDDVDLDEVAAELDGYSAADCVALLREAALTAMRRSIDAADVTAADLAAARKTVRPSLDPGPGGLATGVRQSSLARPAPTPRRRLPASAASARRGRGAGQRHRAGRRPLARRRRRTGLVVPDTVAGPARQSARSAGRSSRQASPGMPRRARRRAGHPGRIVNNSRASSGSSRAKLMAATAIATAVSTGVSAAVLVPEAIARAWKRSQRAQPRRRQDAVAVTEPVIQRAGGRTAGFRDRRDAGRARSAVEHQRPGGVEDHIGFVLPRWCHDLVQSFYMERLPYIDEHAITVDAERAETWSALLRVMCRDPHDPSTVPTGFVLDEARPPERFALKGRHPFAVYRWVFELDAGRHRAGDRTRVRATTWAAFPGMHGKIYRALVIGTGGHRVAVRWTLKRIAATALAERALTGETEADYTDVFEVPIPHGDSRTAEQTFRDAVGDKPGAGGENCVVDPPPRTEISPGADFLA